MVEVRIGKYMLSIREQFSAREFGRTVSSNEFKYCYG